jgi:hypothetical protein
MTVGKETEGYLARGEVIEREFNVRDRFALTGYKVYATNKRLFILRADSIKDIDYNHIASIESKEEVGVPAVVVGLVFLIAGIIVGVLGFTDWWMWALDGFGLALFILGLIPTQSVKLVVVGAQGVETLSGHRSGLDALFRIIREKKPIEE